MGKCWVSAKKFDRQETLKEKKKKKVPKNQPLFVSER